jgi:uncharacterized protein
MRLRCLCLVVLAMVASLYARAETVPDIVSPAQSRARPYAPERISQQTLYSKSGRRFEITIALPKAAPPNGGYPVFYVLDPHTAFATLTETVRNHELMFGPVVVVGVGYETESELRNRMFDLSLPGTDVQTLPAMFREGWGSLGGAASFLAFLQGEVKPAVAAATRIDAGRQALFGHSLGGLFVLYALFTQPDAFDTYIAGSPSIWWGNKLLLQELAAFKAQFAQRPRSKRLLMTMGALEFQTNPEELRLIRGLNLAGAEELPRRVDMLGNAAALAAELAPLTAHGLRVEHVVFPDETHNSVIPAYLSRGARFTLTGWVD